MTVQERASWALLGDPNVLTVPIPLKELHGRIMQALAKAIADEKSRCAGVAWALQMKHFGGGTAIGNAIEDSDNTREHVRGY